MSEFAYWALDVAGASTRGSVSALTAADAALLLRQRGIFAYRLEETRLSSASASLPGGQSLSLHWRRDFAEKLAALTAAGIAIDRALQLIMLQTKGKAHQTVEALLNAVRAGSSLAAALQQERAGFEQYELALIKAGEQSGELSTVLEDLSQILARRAKIAADIVSALIYPLFLLGFAAVSVIVISLVLAPRIAPLFEHNTDAIPTSLQMMLLLSDGITKHPLLLVFVCLLALALPVGLGRAFSWKRDLSRAACSFPLIARITQTSELGRVCNVLAALLKSGVSLQVAIGSSASAASTSATAQALLVVREAVQDGTRLSVALGQVPVFDPASLQLIAVAEETNRLEPVLRNIASAKESEALRLLTRSMSLLTPVLTVLTGILVGGVVMSVMQAILSANDLAIQ
ncbi:type II secretion system F family protein [Aestuariivirga sp.]|uniref:type II secretion system F family protein n=1 Tax=Aestuariivirga sp. TaxID=2650926 RepID=UPI003BAC510F